MSLLLLSLWFYFEHIANHRDTKCPLHALCTWIDDDMILIYHLNMGVALLSYMKRTALWLHYVPPGLTLTTPYIISTECIIVLCMDHLLLRWHYSPGWALASFTICLQASQSLALSLHSFIPIFLRSVDTSSNHLIFGLPLRLVAYSFPYNIFFGIVVSCILSVWPSHRTVWHLMNLTMFFLWIITSNSSFRRILHNPFSFTGPYIFRSIFLSNTANALSSSIVGVHDSEP